MKVSIAPDQAGSSSHVDDSRTNDSVPGLESNFTVMSLASSGSVSVTVTNLGRP